VAYLTSFRSLRLQSIKKVFVFVRKWRPNMAGVILLNQYRFLQEKQLWKKDSDFEPCQKWHPKYFWLSKWNLISLFTHSGYKILVPKVILFLLFLREVNTYFNTLHFDRCNLETLHLPMPVRTLIQLRRCWKLNQLVGIILLLWKSWKPSERTRLRYPCVLR
jgi:hypothetical protein